MIVTNNVADVDIDINKDNVLRRIGCGTDYIPSTRLTSLINDYTDSVYQLIKPSYSYIMKDILSVRGAKVTTEGPITFKSEVIARLLQNCEKVAVFVATIGKRLEDGVHRLAENNLILHSAILDAIGSDITETLAAFVQDRIEELATAEGLCTSRRFSPGYCDWDIKEQKKLFTIMNGNSAGVSLTKECMMLPQKSISGIIGIGPCDNNISEYNPCHTCDKCDCRGRR